MFKIPTFCFIMPFKICTFHQSHNLLTDKVHWSYSGERMTVLQGTVGFPMPTFILIENFEKAIWIHVNSTASISDAKE